MKVLLSWMQEFAPELPTDADVLTEALDDLGTPVEERVRLGEGLDGIVVARVLETRPHPDADRVHLVDVDPGDGGPLQIVCGAFNMQAGDLIPLATLGTTMPNGMGIERRKMRGEWSNGMLCSATEIGLGDDSEGILILSPALTRRPAADRGARPHRGLAVRPRGERQPPRCTVRGRGGPGPGRPAGRRLRAAGVDGADRRRGERGRGLGGDRRPGCLRPLPRQGHPRRGDRPLAGLAGQPHHPGGHAPDQQRGRHLQLRDAGARSPEPRLRPGSRHRGAPTGPLRPGRRDPRHPRRRRADLPARRRPHLRRRRPPDRRRRSDGRRVHRDRRRHHERAARGGLVASDADRSDLDPAEPALRGVPALRTGDRHLGPRPGRGALLRPPVRDRGRRRPRRPRRAGSRARAGVDRRAHRPGEPDHRPRPRRPDRQGPARADRLHRRPRGRRRAGRGRAQLPPRRRRGDRRHRGGGPPPRLRPAAEDRPAVASHRRADRAPAGAPPHPVHARRPRPVRGAAHAVPGPRRPGQGGARRARASGSPTRSTPASRSCAPRYGRVC